MNRKTAVILSASILLVGVAVALERGASSNAAPAGAGAPALGDPTPGPLEVASSNNICTANPAPASANAAFARGSLQAALSSAKILHQAGDELFMTVDVQAATAEMTTRPPMSVAVVIDRSGSMSGDKLKQAKQAALGLIERLSARDRVALVQYDDSAQILLPSTNMDPTGKARASAAIANIYDGGGTNLHDGMMLGVREVMSVASPGALRRVILLSDGQANAGIVDMPTLTQAANQASMRGARLTTIGLGEDYNEELMEALAENGRGHYYYVRLARDLDRVFRGELDSLQATVARNVELVLNPACAGVEVLEVYGYNHRQEDAATVLPLADLFGGDSRRIVVRLRVPSNHPVGARNVLQVAMRYQDAVAGGHAQSELMLGVEISANPSDVDDSANKSVLAEVIKVQSARALRSAASAYQRGDVANASALNRQQRREVMEKAQAYGLDSADMAPVLEELDSQEDELHRYAPSSSAGKAMIKNSKLKARSMSKRKR